MKVWSTHQMCLLAIIAGAAKSIGLEQDSNYGWMIVSWRNGISLLREGKATYFRPKGSSRG